MAHQLKEFIWQVRGQKLHTQCCLMSTCTEGKLTFPNVFPVSDERKGGGGWAIMNIYTKVLFQPGVQLRVLLLQKKG